MRLRLAVFLGYLFVALTGFWLLFHWVSTDLEPEYRKATEEPLVDASIVLASLALEGFTQNGFNPEVLSKVFDNASSHPFSARIYDHTKERMDFMVYVTDENGTVLYDSRYPENEGKDFSKWRDVFLTLKGRYGARTSPDPSGTSIMYVAAPIVRENRTVGVLSLGKSTRAANSFVESTRLKLTLSAAATAILLVAASFGLSEILTRPIRKLTSYARDISKGRKTALPKLGGHEVKNLGEAFEEMRDTLEGKKYMENYIQTLTHEIKSPLSAIRGSAELLDEKMEPEDKKKFITNIRSEAARIEVIIEKLLLLSELEAKKTITQTRKVDIKQLLNNIAGSFKPALEGKCLSLLIDCLDGAGLMADEFLIRHAMVNLVQNAVDFTSEGGSITIACETNPSGGLTLSVSDNGEGIPQYAVNRVSERFYSLKRPGSGKKSTGLGLSLVQEAAALHGGEFFIENLPKGGVRAGIRFQAGSRTA